jgi:hypothetical protein
VTECAGVGVAITVSGMWESTNIPYKERLTPMVRTERRFRENYAACDFYLDAAVCEAP